MTTKSKHFFSRIASLSFLSLLLCTTSLHAQLAVNEVSQGPTGTKEYVELVVTGVPTCSGIPTVDLRGWYIDDNNGNHATGSGTGIATGCMRFTLDPLWAAVPIGTLIVIYNDADLNASIPAQDLSLSDGNCKLVIPASNCTLLEKNSAFPVVGNPVYPTTGFTACGNWSTVGMSNTDDSYQVVNPLGVEVHGVSWGNNNLNSIIYFAGTSAGMVIWNANTSNNNPANQGNWTRTVVAGNETPGLPNNPANAAWIASMNNNCSPFIPLTASGTSTGTCACTGTATASASGGIAPYTYSWAPSGGNAATATGLCPATYTCTVTDVAGCTQQVIVTVSGSAGPPIPSLQSVSNISCAGGSNGSATVTQSGGTAPFTYSWSPSGGNNATATGLGVGTYTCTITDANGCSATQTVNITQPAALSTTSTQNNIPCFGGNNGSMSVIVSGGTPGYTYSWSPSGGSNATAIGQSAGTYTCSITDANGCTTSQIVTLTQPAILAASETHVDLLCNGGGTGSATVNVTGGTSPYNYSWSPSGGNNATATGLAAGTYTCTITDSRGCLRSQTVTITEPSAIVTNPTQIDVPCNGGNNGSATVTPSGGTGPYTYNWAPTGGTTNSETGLAMGTYTCSITDANGCTSTQSFNITQSSSIVVVNAQTNITCNAGNDGTATVTASGGNSPYTYAWAPSGGNNASATGLAVGTYTCTITDANGCFSTQTFSITEPTAITATVASTNITCFGGNNGSSTVTPSGGTSPYTFNWLPSGGTNATANGLTVGIYTCNITDANGCTSSQTVSITQPTAVTATSTHTNILCYGGNNGSATVTPNGGTGPYTFNWTPSGGTNATASGLGVGTFTCTITDANGCTTTQTVSITQPSVLSASIVHNNIACNGGSNGSANVTPSGGTGPYTYSWSPSGGTNSTALGLGLGSYTCTITDANGCTTTQSTTITEPPVLTATSSSVSANCAFADGSATATPVGGTGPYTYQWSPSGGTAATAANITAGTYTCSVIDANGCIVTTSVTVTSVGVLPNAVITVNGSTTFCQGDSIVLTASGGTSFLWSTGATSTSITVSAAGTYTLTAFNTCGSDTAQVAVQTSTVQALFTASPDSGLVPLPVSFTDNSNNAITWNWNFGNNDGSSSQNPSVTYNAPGVYPVTLVVTNADGCTDSYTLFVIVTDVPGVIDMPNVFTPNGDAINDIFIPHTEGLAEFTMEIYDRWGVKIETSNDVNEGWDGRSSSGNTLTDGTYYYVVRAKAYNGQVFELAGFFTLIR